jgi:hypothetical protein
MISNDELRQRYGDDAIISRASEFVLVHLDHPSDEVVDTRTAGFDPDDYLDPECPLCQILRAGGVFVFDGYGEDCEDEILLE